LRKLHLGPVAQQQDVLTVLVGGVGRVGEVLAPLYGLLERRRQPIARRRHPARHRATTPYRSQPGHFYQRLKMPQRPNYSPTCVPILLQKNWNFIYFRSSKIGREKFKSFIWLENEANNVQLFLGQTKHCHRLMEINLALSICKIYISVCAIAKFSYKTRGYFKLPLYL